MNEKDPVIHPYWRAVIGGAFGLGIGAVLLWKGFWAAVLLLVLVLVGAAVSVVAVSGD